jgi:hypothetical protein
MVILGVYATNRVEDKLTSALAVGFCLTVSDGA